MNEYSGIYRPHAEEPGEHRWRDILIALAATGGLFYVWLGYPGIDLPMLIGAGAILVVAGFKRPAIPCLFFVIFSFLRVHEAFPFLIPWRIPQLLAQLSIVVVFWHLVLARSMKPFWSRELALFAAFFLITTATIVTSTNREQSYVQWADVYLKIGVIVLVLTWSTRAATDFQLIARILTLFGAAVSLVAIDNWFDGEGLVEGTRVTIGRAMGSVLGDPNDLSLALLFPLSFAVALAVGRVNVVDRLIGLAGTSTILLGILFTQSRGGLLGVAALFAVFASRMIKSKILLIGIGAAAVVFLFVVAGIGGRSSGGAGQGIDESSEGRLNAWHTAWNMAVARPLTGVGLGNFADNYWEFTPYWDGKAHAVHSTWFGVLAETGFPGLLVFLAMVGTTGLVSWRCLKMVNRPGADPRLHTAAAALSAGLASFCVSGTFLTQGFTWPFYIIFALTISLFRVLTDYQDQEAQAAPGLSPPPRPTPVRRI
ncbi:O-antigen ligase family protein [Aquabacter spiritensis]|uniref:Putative O-glycosylation ligase (Exosortase A-associated) n=1 Tax=Aquabacter spiritensis TaxID=933073 RepID=A0A4V2UYA0_9HYPH|nr:O-antigen ligase family protein [Aquabacter spiritensis]TCT06568.1 putative O-glycosylation ligase (exosortase A-associated) [Aquabacter spiritensis]